MRKKFSSDLGGVIGAGFMALFIPLAAWRWFFTGSLFFALLLWRDLITCYFFLKRNQPSRAGSGMPVLLAYISTILPLFYKAPSEPVSTWQMVNANVLFVVGFCLSTLATIELGTSKSMGVVPAYRGTICRSGVYRVFQHPMYTGYIVAEMGCILTSHVNAYLFAASTACYLFRMHSENKLLTFEPKKSLFDEAIQLRPSRVPE